MMDSFLSIIFCMGFSLLSTLLRVFQQKNEARAKHKTHLLCGWSKNVIQRNTFPSTIELFSHYC